MLTPKILHNLLAGYYIYRNGEKIFDGLIGNGWLEDFDATKPAGYYCYQVTAVYLIDGVEIESDFSDMVCYDVDSIEEISLFGLQISPNPTSGIIDIFTGLESFYTVSIYGLDGALIYRQHNFFDGQLDLSHLAKGTYFLNISTSKSSVSRRVILE